MNDLQEMMDEGNTQSREVNQEAFTIVGEVAAISRLATFGDPQIMPIEGRQGYQDYLVTPMKIQASEFAGAKSYAPGTDNLARKFVVRTATGRSLYVQVVDYTEVVAFTLLLTDRAI